MLAKVFILLFSDRMQAITEFKSEMPSYPNSIPSKKLRFHFIGVYRRQIL